MILPRHHQKVDFDISLIKSTANASNPNFGYFGGGSSISTVRRIDFSNDTATPVVRGPLTRNMSHEPGVGARSDGFVPILGPSVVENAAAIQIQKSLIWLFWCGGNPANPAGVSTIDRIDYSSDTSNCITQRQLTRPGTIYGINRQIVSFGYFASGYTSRLTVIDRLDYSNDTANNVTVAILVLQEHIRQE